MPLAARRRRRTVDVFPGEGARAAWNEDLLQVSGTAAILGRAMRSGGQSRHGREWRGTSVWGSAEMPPDRAGFPVEPQRDGQAAQLQPGDLRLRRPFAILGDLRP